MSPAKERWAGLTSSAHAALPSLAELRSRTRRVNAATDTADTADRGAHAAGRRGGAEPPGPDARNDKKTHRLWAHALSFTAALQVSRTGPKPQNSIKLRAGEGIRTLDVNLGKVALYH